MNERNENDWSREVLCHFWLACHHYERGAGHTQARIIFDVLPAVFIWSHSDLSRTLTLQPMFPQNNSPCIFLPSGVLSDSIFFMEEVYKAVYKSIQANFVPNTDPVSFFSLNSAVFCFYWVQSVSGEISVHFFLPVLLQWEGEVEQLVSNPRGLCLGTA